MFVQLCPHIRVFLQHSGKGPIKNWHDPQHLKVATRIKGVLSTKIKQKIAQLQDNWTSRTSAVQIRVFDRLRPPEGNFHLRMSQYLKIWFNMLKRTPRVHSQVHNCPRECIPQNQKLGFHSVNFIYCTKGKIEIFANIKYHDL